LNPLEKNIENQIKRYLDSIGAYHIKTHGSVYSRAGVPDLIACINGHFVGIEVKRPKGIVSELQKMNISMIEKAGGEAFVAYSVDDVKKELQQRHVI